MNDVGPNGVNGQTRSSGFGQMASNVPPPGQIPSIDTTMSIPAAPVPNPSDITQSQESFSTMTTPMSSNVTPPTSSTAKLPEEAYSNGTNSSNAVNASTTSAKPEYAAIPPPAVVTLSLSSTSTAGQVVAVSEGQTDAQMSEEAEKAKQEELQKKLMEGQEPATIAQQENMQIKGQSARHLVMQKVEYVERLCNTFNIIDG